MQLLMKLELVCEIRNFQAKLSYILYETIIIIKCFINDNDSCVDKILNYFYVFLLREICLKKMECTAVKYHHESSP